MALRLVVGIAAGVCHGGCVEWCDEGCLLGDYGGDSLARTAPFSEGIEDHNTVLLQSLVEVGLTVDHPSSALISGHTGRWGWKWKRDYAMGKRSGRRGRGSRKQSKQTYLAILWTVILGRVVWNWRNGEGRLLRVAKADRLSWRWVAARKDMGERMRGSRCGFYVLHADAGDGRSVAGAVLPGVR